MLYGRERAGAVVEYSEVRDGLVAHIIDAGRRSIVDCLGDFVLAAPLDVPKLHDLALVRLKL